MVAVRHRAAEEIYDEESRLRTNLEQIEKASRLGARVPNRALEKFKADSGVVDLGDVNDARPGYPGQEVDDQAVETTSSNTLKRRENSTKRSSRKFANWRKRCSKTSNGFTTKTAGI